MKALWKSSSLIGVLAILSLPVAGRIPLGHWTFDQGAGASAGGWRGTLHDDATIDAPESFVGAGSYANPGGRGFLETSMPGVGGGESRSISLWFRMAGGAGNQETLVSWGSTQGRFDFGLGDGGRQVFATGISQPFDLPATVSDGQWHHVLLAYRRGSPGAYHLFLDGKLAGTASLFGLSTTSDSPVRIGTGATRSDAAGATGRDFNGWLDDFALFGTSLDAADAALVHGLGRLGLDLSHFGEAAALLTAPEGARAHLGGRKWQRAAGLPGAAGDWGGTLAGGDAWIVTADAGIGIRIADEMEAPPGPPFGWADVPAEIEVRSGASASAAPRLVLEQGSAVEWQARVVDASGRSSSLADAAAAWLEASPRLMAALPSPQLFEGGETGTAIQEPLTNSRAFTNGNILMTSAGGPIPYSDGAVDGADALGAGGRYFTWKFPGLFLFAGDFRGPTWFEAGGNAAHGSPVHATRFSLRHAGRVWRAFGVSRESTFGPCVQQLYLVDDAGAGQMVFPTWSSNDLQSKVEFSGNRRVLYATFATTKAAGREVFRTLAGRMLEALPDVPRGIGITPSAGTLADQADLELRIDAEGLEPGTADLFLDAVAADGSPERAPLKLVVREPALRLDRSEVLAAAVPGAPAKTVSLGTTTTESPGVAWTAQLAEPQPWVELLTSGGTTPDAVQLRFNAPGLAIGTYRTTLEIRTAEEFHRIPVNYSVDALAVNQLLTDPLRSVIYGLNAGVHGGSVLVMHPTSGEMLDIIRTGRRPGDMCFDPTGAKLYVANDAESSITCIDLDRREVLATREVPGESHDPARTLSPPFNIAAGRDGRVFYTDGAARPDLRLVDFATGEGLAHVPHTRLPAVQGNPGFGDLHFDPVGARLFFNRRSALSSGSPLQLGMLDASDGSLPLLGLFPEATTETMQLSSSQILAPLGREFLLMDQGRFLLPELALEPWRFASRVLAVSAYGDLAALPAAIHDARNGQKLMDLPLAASLAAVTPDQSGVLVFRNAAPHFVYTPFAAAIRPAEIAARPSPPSGGALGAGEDTLRWTALPFVEGYRIYLGSDAAAVAAAGPGAPEDRGVVAQEQFKLDPLPDSGTYFWRIDAVRGGEAIAGEVWSFRVASFRVTPATVTASAPLGALPQAVVLQPATAQGQPVAWTATTSTPWLTLPAASGEAGEPLELMIDSTGLATGPHAGIVTVSGEGLALEVPVTLQVFEIAQITELRPDPVRPVVYGLEPGVLRESPGRIVRIDPASGRYIDALPLAHYASTFAVHPAEDRLYVPDPFSNRLSVFSLPAGEALPDLSVDSWTATGQIAAGPAGVIFLDNDDWTASLHRIDTTTGGSLETLPVSATSGPQPLVAVDAGLRFLVRTNREFIQKLNLTDDPPSVTEEAELTGADWLGGSWLGISADGRRIVIDRSVLDPELRHVATLPEKARAVSGDGGVAVTLSGAYWADTGGLIKPLPPGLTALTLSGDGGHVVAWDESEAKIVSIPFASLVPGPPPSPLPGERLSAPPERLAWTPVDGATGYRIYLGTSASAAEAAGPGSLLELGTTSATFLDLDPPLETGFRYHWRVDALMSNGVSKGTVQFFDVPFPQIAAAPIAGELLDVGDDREVLIAGGAAAQLVRFDPATGRLEPVQTLRNAAQTAGLQSTPTGSLGSGVAVLGEPEFRAGGVETGRAVVHERFRTGRYFPEAYLSAPDSSTRFGRAVAYDGGQLLVASASGRVQAFSRWPGWHPVGDLVPREEAGGFGAAIAMDGLRAIVGAPDAGKAFAFMYSSSTFPSWQPVGLPDFDSSLAPPVDGRPGPAGGAVATGGLHAALGPGPDASLFGHRRVHVFLSLRDRWARIASLEDPEPPADPLDTGSFGYSLAMEGDTLFVAAPYAVWRGQTGGVIHCYRLDDRTVTPLAPIVPPPGGTGFGLQLEVRDGLLYASQQSLTGTGGKLIVHRIDPEMNRRPRFVTPPPVQMDRQAPFEYIVEADDAEDRGSLTFEAGRLPNGIQLEDLGNGRARLFGTPRAVFGPWQSLHLTVRDAAGAEAHQTAALQVLAPHDLPRPAALPARIELREGEDLVLKPVVEGTGPFSFRWFRDEAELDEPAGGTLSIPTVGAGAAGIYHAEVTNGVGTSETSRVTVVVSPADRFTSGWTTAGSAPDRDGHLAATLGRHRFAPAWSARLSMQRLAAASIADGRLVVTPRVGNSSPAAHALAPVDGSILWSHAFQQAAGFSGPSIHAGGVFIQRHGTAGSELWHLALSDGSERWRAPLQVNGSGEVSPVADDGGIFAGTSSGLHGYTWEGAAGFSSAPPGSWPSPVLSNGRLFTLAGGFFTEYDPLTGLPRWDLPVPWPPHGGIETTPVVKDDRAYIRVHDGLLCIGLLEREVLWETPGGFAGSPALFRDRLYVPTGNSVKVLSAIDGTDLGTLATTGAPRGQPVVLNDHVIVSGADTTWIFDAADGTLLQTLDVAGEPSFAEGHLFLAGADGVLRAFRASAPPVFIGETDPTIDAGPAAAERRIRLGDLAVDPDPGETLAWSVASDSIPGLFETVGIDEINGELVLRFNPWLSGRAEIQVAATDPAGNRTEATIAVVVPPHPEPDLQLAENLVLNRQTGLYEHTITVSNTAAREIAGFDLAIAGLPPGVTVHNASGGGEGTWTVQHRQPLAAGESITLVLEYHVPGRGATFEPQVSVTLVTQPEADPAADQPGLAVDRTDRLPDGSMLIEFTAMPGRSYEIQYSNDASDWKVSPLRIRAAGTRVQWIDRGPPGTDSPPAGHSSRFYRVREISQP